MLAAHTPLPPVAAKIVSIAVTFVFNFAMNALLVFRGPPPGDDGALSR